jgi:prevent-host-death family protein
VKTVGVTEARERLAELLDSAQGEAVGIIRHGKPLAVVVGVEGQDLVQVIEQHRRPPGPASVAKPRRQKA